MGDENNDAPSKPRHFVFSCQKCGESCRRKHVPVHLTDVENWVRDGTIERVAAHLIVGAEEGEAFLELSRGDEKEPL